ncbi:MAG: HD domain-containing protein [Proteobacteria bacterium]|nr:MAG: HD domain-containing protein [Pseudomonadota bacterium]
MSNVYRIPQNIRERFKVTALKPDDLSRLRTLGLEHFDYLKFVSKINFPIYFRVDFELLEFITPENFSHELLDRIIAARARDYDNLDICVKTTDYPKFQILVQAVRNKKIESLLERDPLLDRKTLEIFSNLSGASEMIVRGGITSLVAQQARNAASQLIDNLLDSHVAIGTLSRMVMADSTLYDHSASVAMLSGIIARNLMGLSRDDAERCARGGLYHDVGKTCIPNDILNKPGKFSPEEFEVMKTHTTLGYQELLDAMASGAPIEPEVAMVSLEHHEKFMGGGYPLGKLGRREDRKDGISLYARVVTIADVYSALLMKRVYKEAYDQDQTLEIMRKTAPNDYDPSIWSRFEKSVSKSQAHYKELESRPIPNASDKGRIFIKDGNGLRPMHNLKKSS